MYQLRHIFFLLLAMLPVLLLAVRERSDMNQAGKHATYDARRYNNAADAKVGSVGAPVSPNTPPGSQPGMSDDSDSMYHSYQGGNQNGSGH